MASKAIGDFADFCRRVFQDGNSLWLVTRSMTSFCGTFASVLLPIGELWMAISVFVEGCVRLEAILRMMVLVYWIRSTVPILQPLSDSLVNEVLDISYLTLIGLVERLVSSTVRGVGSCIKCSLLTRFTVLSARLIKIVSFLRSQSLGRVF